MIALASSWFSTGNELLRITELVLSWRDDADRKQDLELLRKLFDKGPLREIANPAFDPDRGGSARSPVCTTRTPTFGR